jgi:hypothetical protein
MINLLGKSLAFLHVSLSILMMVFALALYLNAVDIGWKEPRRYWREVEGKKGENLLVPSLIDKREAAFRKLVRFKRDELLHLGQAQVSFAEVEMFLGDNHVKADAILEKLEKGEGEFAIKDIKFDDATGALSLEPGPHQLGFPSLETPVPGVNMSYTGYLAKLEDVDKRIRAVQDNTAAILKKEEAITKDLIGNMDKDGKQERDKSGSVTRPGWYYLVEAEVRAQNALKKELEYVQPLWVKELVDAQLLVSRRDILQRRLQELGDKGYLSQSDFLRKIQ